MKKPVPVLSASAWQVAHEIAERCVPRLIARGRLDVAINLARRSKQFAENAKDPTP